jgi:hypothetical protein
MDVAIGRNFDNPRPAALIGPLGMQIVSWNNPPVCLLFHCFKETPVGKNAAR